MAPRTTIAVAAVTSATPLTITVSATAPTAILSASFSNTTTSTSQAPNWTAQNLQNVTPKKQQQLLQQRQPLQQILEKQQAQVKKRALKTGNSITATSEPDIQSTWISRQRSKRITSQSSNLPSQFLKATRTSSSNLSHSSSLVALNKKSISNGSSTPFSSTNSLPSGKLLDSKFKAKPVTRGKSKKVYSSFGDGVHSDDGEENMKVGGVNLQVWCSV